MNITILTYGSRGDVQPFLPLAIGLMARGHKVNLAAPQRFESLIAEHGIHFSPLAGDPEDLSRQLNNAGYNFVKLMRVLLQHGVQVGAEVLRQTEAACQNADLIVHTFTHAVGGHTLARQLNIPDVHIQTFPMFTPTGDYPNIALPDLGLRSLNRFTHVVSKWISWQTARFGFEQIRRRAKLPKLKLYSPFDVDPHRPPAPVLCAWSPSILPPSGDWKSNVHVTGYYFFDLDLAYKPPGALQEFLTDGESPVCISFGSMVYRELEHIDQIVRDALKNTRQRGIILSGWGGVKHASSRELLYLDAVPHDWLLPRCKMIIHHGGAGTTSAGLRAGIPNVVVPFMADQPFWGKRVHMIGAGPQPILVKKLAVENLTHAMLEAETSVMRDRADSIGQKIRSETGVELAIRLIESQLSK